MNKVLKLATVFTLVASSAFAAESNNNFYASLNGVVGKSTIKVSDEESKNNKITPVGADIALGGYLSPEVRAEVAFNYLTGKRKETSTISNNIVINQTSVETKLNSLSLMLNAYYDFMAGETISPYVMGGIGAARNKLTFTVTKNSSSGSAKKSKNNFAWQVGTGVNIKAAENIKIDVGYRYKNLTSSSLKLEEGGDSVKAKIKPAHLFLAGVRFEF